MSKAEKIVELFKAGKSKSEIAEEVGVKYQYVYNVLIIKGLIKPGESRRERSSSRERGYIPRKKSIAELEKEKVGLEKDVKNAFYNNRTMYVILKKKLTKVSNQLLDRKLEKDLDK